MSTTTTASDVNPLLKFFKAPEEIKETPRLAISLDALDKCGKTHYSLLTTPHPIALVTNDTGTMHVVKKARKLGIQIPYILEQSIARPDAKIISAKNVDEDDQKAWKKEWSRFEDCTKALADGDKRVQAVRTFVIDNGSELANLCELAHFGKLRGNARIDIRAEYNASFSKWFWDLYKGRPDLNIIIIHQVKKEYKPNSKGNDSWTGKYERKGFTNIGYAVDMSVRAGWEPTMKDFYTEIDGNQATRYGSELVGKRWYARPTDDAVSPSHFAHLAMSVFPETELEPEYWGLKL